jgi:hypothetical protein
MTARRLKSASVVAILATSGLVFLAWTRDWFVLEVTAGGSADLPVVVTGETAAPALAALGLAGLAAGAALSIAGRLVRALLAVLVVVIGGCVGLSGLIAAIDPVAASGAAVSEATGIAGDESISAAVGSVTDSPWPIVTIAIGVLLSLSGLAVIVTGRRWAGPSRKYEAVRYEPADAGGPLDAVDSWDELSRGDDPTR